MDVIFLSHVIVLALLTSNMGTVSSKGQAQSMTLPDDEVEALREIAAQLNKKDWNFSDPCSNIPTFSTPHTDQYNNTLFCNCSISVDVCHVESIFLTAQELDGVLPPSLAKLPYLKKVYLRANNLTGELPVALTNLNKLKVLWIGSNNFTGRIPDYFLSWKELQMLEMQGSGLEGPIPSSLSALKHMTYLCISDLSGVSADFPNLSNMTNMQTLDLSFNRLTGNIPNLVNLLGLATIIVDLSYNNFSENSIPTTCRETLILSNCLSPCSKVHINCGGKQLTVGNIKYDGDEASGGGAKFVHDTENWGFSSTGDFGLINYDQDYIAKNISVLKMNNSELYRTARISPLSLTYYARCLANGNYTVKLHFAEIVMRNNRSYYSVGRRIFDVYIQEKLVLKDFDIEKEAQGVDKEVIKVFNAVVNVATLEIRFYWAGKGTSNAPERGIYGSLISAISVESDFKPPADSKTKIYIVVVVVSALCLFFVTAAILWLRCCKERRTSTREQVKLGYDKTTSPLCCRGYMAPEYALWGHLTDKVDVYSFGVVALELISGKNNIKFRPYENYVCLLDWAFVLQQTGNLMELIDPKLGSDFNKEQAMRMIKVAILCTNPAPALRPTMSAVVSMLEGRAIVHELNINPSIYGDEMRFESLRDESNSRSACETESLIYLSDPIAIPSSHSSVQDLYPVNFDS
ncbi:hypothetical protein DVH24_017394 [Malus domestica]|uniref:non-specific serine/threonine protein kinase n=1 Tax=Malus domestica TaxID=3750 RepID=A0A498IYJ0_MALDO|nr:hypothetical protein DVH24_017394 [Malus domestica]